MKSEHEEMTLIKALTKEIAKSQIDDAVDKTIRLIRSKKDHVLKNAIERLGIDVEWLRICLARAYAKYALEVADELVEKMKADLDKEQS